HAAMITSASPDPKNCTASSRLGKHQSQWASDATIVARARARGHSDNRRFVSYDTWTPDARATVIAANAASHAEADIACEMPETCSKREWRMMSAGRSAGVRRLAADPARK